MSDSTTADVDELERAVDRLSEELRECAAASQPATAVRMRTIAMSLGGLRKSIRSAVVSRDPLALVALLLQIDDTCHDVAGLEIGTDNAPWRLVGDEKIQRVFDVTIPMRKKLIGAAV